MSLDVYGLIKDGDPPLAFRFAVTFIRNGKLPNPLDIKFQKVSGLVSEVTTTTLGEGGQNLYSHYLPEKVSYNHLVLERGMAVGSLLNDSFKKAMLQFNFHRYNVLVALLDDAGLPVSAWFFKRAYPVKWAVNDLNATSDEVVIDTMELVYSKFQHVRV